MEDFSNVVLHGEARPPRPDGLAAGNDCHGNRLRSRGTRALGANSRSSVEGSSLANKRSVNSTHRSAASWQSAVASRHRSGSKQDAVCPGEQPRFPSDWLSFRWTQSATLLSFEDLEAPSLGECVLYGAMAAPRRRAPHDECSGCEPRTPLCSLVREF